jgi:hypothetical protein
MSTEERELYFSIIEEVYQKGTSGTEISVEALFDDIRKKLSPLLIKDIHREETRSV